MIKIDFGKITVEINFEGETREVNVRKDMANYVKMNTADIGLEDLCREIYHSTGAVEVPDEYIQPLTSIIASRECPLYAFAKRGILKALNNKEE